LEVYAIQAKDAELIAPGVRTRKFAVRRIGELIEEQRRAGMLAKPPIGPGHGKKGKSRVFQKPDFPTLAAQGVDKNLAHQARTAAAMSEAKFEAEVNKVIRLAVSIAAWPGIEMPPPISPGPSLAKSVPRRSSGPPQAVPVSRPKPAGFLVAGFLVARCCPRRQARAPPSSPA
jgi:hypothetical protein